MANLLNVIAVILGIIFLIPSIRYIFKNSICFSPYIYVIFFWLFILPLLLDIIAGHPADYLMLKNITIAVKDDTTNIIYALFVIFFTLSFFLFVKNDYKKSRNRHIDLSNNLILLYRKWKHILLFIIVSPVIIFLFVPNKDSYLIYGTLGRRGLEEVPPIINYLYLAINFSTIAVFVSIIFKDKGISSIYPYIPILFINIWLNGKRNIVALIVIFILYLILSEKRISTSLKIISLSIVFVGIISFFSFYMTIKEGLQREGFMRIEFFRDHTVKFAIFSELYPDEVKILNYKGESLLFYATIYVPRTIWEDKPMPYAQYLTSAALDVSPQFLGWGITNSVFDELICNLGLWVILFFPIIIKRIIKFGQSAHNRFASIFTILIIGLLFSVQITAYFILYILYVCFIIYSRYTNKKQTKIEKQNSDLLCIE